MFDVNLICYYNCFFVRVCLTAGILMAPRCYVSKNIKINDFITPLCAVVIVSIVLPLTQISVSGNVTTSVEVLSRYSQFSHLKFCLFLFVCVFYFSIIVLLLCVCVHARFRN